jgi:hypothetical protein
MFIHLHLHGKYSVIDEIFIFTLENKVNIVHNLLLLGYPNQ